MYKIKLNMYDQFSGATDSRLMTVSDSKLAKIEQLQMNQVPVREFSEDIVWFWIIEEIEILTTEVTT